VNPNYPENKAAPTRRAMTKGEATFYYFKGFNEGSVSLRTELSAIAAPELGLLPTLTVDEEGIWITREDGGGYTVKTYGFKPPSEWSEEQVVEFAARVLEVRPLTSEWLVGAGFKRCYGAFTPKALQPSHADGIPGPPALTGGISKWAYLLLLMALAGLLVSFWLFTKACIISTMK